MPRPRKPDPPPADIGADLDARREQRRVTAAALRTGRTPLQVVAAVEAAVAAPPAALKDRPPVPPPACTVGCTWCCHKPVGLAAAEVVRIVAYLTEMFPVDAIRALSERAARADDVRRAIPPDRRTRAGIQCPLLDDGKCVAYPVRPLTCRGYNSYDPGACRAAVETGRVGAVPMDAAWHRSHTFVLDGLRAGLAEAGLDGRLLELIPALRLALDTPDAGSRWLSGEPVFAPAAL